MDQDRRIAELEKESHRWMFSNTERYRQIATEMITLSRRASATAKARAHRAYSNALRMDGKWEEALRFAQQALRLWRRAGDEVEWARTQTTLIPILAQLGLNRRAMAASRAGLAVFLRNDQSLPAARLLNNTGGIYLYTGQAREALRCFQQASDLARKAGDLALGARAEWHQASALQALGRHHEALRHCIIAWRPTARTGQALNLARIHVVAATSLFQLGRFGKALRRFAKARTLFEREEAARDVAECDLHICACYIELNRYAPALNRMESFLEQPGRAWFEIALASYYQGVALAHLGRPLEARVALKRASRLFSRHGDRLGSNRARLEEAELLLQLGSAREAARLALRVARDQEGRSGLELARASLVMAAAWLSVGRLNQAERHAGQARLIGQRARMPGLTFRAFHLLGQVAIRRRRFDEAGEFLARAVRLAEQMRATVQLEFRNAFLADKAAAYADLVWVRLQQGKAKAARQLMEQAKSRALADHLAATPSSGLPRAGSATERLLREMEDVRREYQQLTSPAYLTGASAGTPEAQNAALDRRTGLEKRLGALWDEWELRSVGWATAAQAIGQQGMKRLGNREVLIEYMVVQERLIAFGSDRTGLRGWVELGPIEGVVRSLELLQLNFDATLNLRHAAPLVGMAKNAKRQLRDLYERIWAPLPWLTGAERILIIPHGPLHQVPFGALYDGERYLVERVELTMAPSRTVWQACCTRGSKERATTDLVLCFNPGGELPYVEAEAVAVAQQLETDVWLDQAATTERFLQTGPYRVLHLAVHGQFRPDNPQFSTLLLADGSLTAADVTGLRLEAALLTLSACETGLSRVSHGEELTGLITAFLTAGSSATLASLWRVDDAATADLMVRFYQALLGGQRKSAALRQAQIEILHQRTHPVFWAGFAVIGDGGPLPVSE